MIQGSSLATPRAYSIEAFCAAFGLGRTSAFNEIKNGRLKARKVGKRTIIRADDAEAWAASLPERSGVEEAA